LRGNIVRIFKSLSCTLLSVSLLITGCVSTSIQTDWKDPSFRGTFKKVLVICNVKDPLIRTTLEGDLAAQFTRRGIEAVQSTTLYASLKDVDRERIKRKVREMDVDGVLLIRPVNHKMNTYETYDWWDVYTDAPDQTLTAEIYRVQVSLFEAAKGKVVWQALSDTIVGGAWMDTVKEFARVMGAKLIERGLI
jgi:CRISPR/Cas system-associated endoribonuclease Cas2